MSDLLELPATVEELTAFNLRRWEEVLADPELRRVTGRVETDRFGRIIMSPPPAFDHGGYQIEIGHLIKTLMDGGRVTSETPISTPGGVRAADVTWASARFMSQLPGRCACLPMAPEICVEVVSPSNTKQELEEKRQLYFAAGATEFWLCIEGEMRFYLADGDETVRASLLCPGFPGVVAL